MDPKANVIKSKSSNSAITTKSDNHNNKKTRSNAEFQRGVLKKRGVYVEKKPTKLIFENTNTEIQNKAPKPVPRCRPPRKRFLNSVLTILSKATTGTQYPDTAEKIEKVHRKVDKPKTRMRRKIDLDVDGSKRKPKYKSKVLNGEAKKSIDQEKFVVLKSKKEVIQTPSNYSEADSRGTDLPPLVKVNNELNLAMNEDISSNTQSVIKEILDGKKLKQGKKVRIDDPVTLVENGDGTKEDKFYNFFVDLLETTFSVYNVKTEYDAARNEVSEVSSKVALEIEESVAKKLNLTDSPEMFDDVTQKPSNRFVCLHEKDEIEYEKLQNYFENQTNPYKQYTKQAKSKKKLNTQSFICTKKSKLPIKTESFITPKKSYTRKNKKTTLINLFKQQLKMNYEEFEEPQNLYQALRLIARNKRKYQKSIHFDVSANNDEYKNCMFQRRKVLSPSTKLPKNMQKYYDFSNLTSIEPSKGSVYSKKRYNRSDYTNFEDKESDHTLEVYTSEYEPSIKRRARKHNVVLPYVSASPSEFEYEIDDTIFKDTASEASTSKYANYSVSQTFQY